MGGGENDGVDKTFKSSSNDDDTGVPTVGELRGNHDVAGG